MQTQPHATTMRLAYINVKSASYYNNDYLPLSRISRLRPTCRSWITSRTHQPQYIIARSVVISSIGFLVTICVAFCLALSIYLWIQVKVFVIQWDMLTWLRAIAIAVQGIFILSGWAMICWRWLMAVVFYPRLVGKESLSLEKYFQVEDFWKRSMLELQEEFMEWNLESIKSLSFLNKFLFMFIQKLRLYKLLPFFSF